MWMEIQRGEGPQAPPLNDESVYVGDVLTLIFTLSDNVYWFDSNILTCYAVDGKFGGKVTYLPTFVTSDINSVHSPSQTVSL